MAAAPPLPKQRRWLFLYAFLPCAQTGLAGHSGPPTPPTVRKDKRKKKTPPQTAKRKRHLVCGVCVYACLWSVLCLWLFVDVGLNWKGWQRAAGGRCPPELLTTWTCPLSDSPGFLARFLPCLQLSKEVTYLVGQLSTVIVRWKRHFL